MKKISSVIVLVLALLACSVYGQDVKGAQALLGKSTQPQALTPVLTTPQPVTAPAVAETTAPQTNRVSALVAQKSRVSYSIRSRGFLQNPKTGAVLYEVVTLRERGLWGNGCLTQLLVNDDGQPVAVLNTSASAGPGIALIQGASFVGGMYLFAEHLRPPKQNVNSNNSNSGNSGTGATTVNNNLSANATGGQGGAGGVGGSATATGGTASADNTVTGGLGNGGTQSVIVNSGAANGNGQIILGGGAAPAP